MIKRIELQDGNYSIIVENIQEKEKTNLGIENWQLIFTRKQDVENHIALLQKALEFWEYD